VYQDGNKISLDENGKPFYFWTAPRIDDDYIIIPITCDNNSSLTGGSPVVGGWSQVRAIAEANPDKAVYLMHVDDILGYNDTFSIDDGNVDGYVSPQSDYDGWEYGYALASLAAYGLFDSTNADTFSAPYIDWGQQADRRWCYRNCPMLPQKGDHDSGHNEMSWDIVKTDDVTSITGGLATPKKAYDNSKVVYDAFLKPLQGASIQNLDTGANHWHHTLGCLKIVSMDAMTNGSGDAVKNEAWTRPTDIFGANQVADSIAQMDVVLPFKMMPFANGIRYVGADDPHPSAPLPPGTAHKNRLGAQNPFGDNPSVGDGLGSSIPAHAEYRQLFTNAGGLMDLDNTNGTDGVFFTVHGDWHSSKVTYNHSNTGDFDESFTSISVGTINGSVNFYGSAWDVPGNTFDGSTIDYADGGLFSNEWWVCPLFVYGSRAIPEIEAVVYDMNNNVLWNKKFVANSGNQAKPI